MIDAAQSRCGPDTQALTEKFDYLHGLGCLNAHAAQRARFAKGFPALQTLKPANNAVSVSKTARSFCCAIAANTRHLTLSRRGHKVTVFRKKQQLRASPPFVAARSVLKHCPGLLLKCRVESRLKIAFCNRRRAYKVRLRLVAASSRRPSICP